MTKILMFQTNSPLRNEYFLGCFEHSNFGFVSGFDIRISDLTGSTVNHPLTGVTQSLVLWARIFTSYPIFCDNFLIDSMLDCFEPLKNQTLKNA